MRICSPHKLTQHTHSHSNVNSALQPVYFCLFCIYFSVWRFVVVSFILLHSWTKKHSKNTWAYLFLFILFYVVFIMKSFYCWINTLAIVISHMTIAAGSRVPLWTRQWVIDSFLQFNTQYANILRERLNKSKTKKNLVYDSLLLLVVLVVCTSHPFHHRHHHQARQRTQIHFCYCYIFSVVKDS